MVSAMSSFGKQFQLPFIPSQTIAELLERLLVLSGDPESQLMMPAIAEAGCTTRPALLAEDQVVGALRFAMAGAHAWTLLGVRRMR